MYPSLTRLGEVVVQHYERYLPTAFSSNLSLLEKVNMVIEYLNQTGKTVNEALTFIENAIEKQDLSIDTLENEVEDFKKSVTSEILPNNVERILDTWFVDGKLTKLVGEKVLGLKADVDYVNDRLSLKRNDTGLFPINKSEFDSETKQELTGGSVAVVGANVVGQVELKSKGIDEDKISFLNVISNNLVNPNKIRKGGYYAENTANLDEWVPSTNFDSVRHVAVEAGQQYTRNSVSSIVVHDINFSPITGLTTAGQTVTMPANAKYATFNFYVNPLIKHQINKGSQLLAYDTFKVEQPNLMADEKNIKPTTKFNPLNVDGVVEVTTENLFNKDTVTVGYVDDAGNHVNDSNYRLSALIEVKQGSTYRSLTPGYRPIYNAQGVFVGTIAGSGNIVIPTNLNVKYIKQLSSLANLEKEMFVEGTVLPAKYIPFKRFGFDPSKFSLPKTALYGLKHVAVGDSQTVPNYSYANQISEKYGTILTKFALNGRSIARRGGQTDVDFPPLVDVIGSIPTDFDILTLLMMTNDYGSQVPIGDKNSSDLSTFNGALNHLCKEFITRYHGKKFIFFNCFQRIENPNVVRNIPITDYVNAFMERTAFWGVPSYNLFANSLLNPNIPIINQTYFMNQDGLHPNYVGHNVGAVSQIKNAMLSLLN